VIEALRSGDFYKPADTLVFDAVLNLYSRGEPADTITVARQERRLTRHSSVRGAVRSRPVPFDSRVWPLGCRSRMALL